MLSDFSYVLPKKEKQQYQETFAILLILAVFIGTFMRVSLLLLYPFVVLFLAIYFRFRFTNRVAWLILAIFLCTALSFANGLYLKYKLMSLFYMLPFVLLMFSGYTPKTRGQDLHIFMRSMTIVCVVNNIVGFIQMLVLPSSDDNFIGIFSHYSISINGLSVLNSVIFFYHFSLFLRERKWKHLFTSIFFIVSSVLGFYGAGLVAFFAAFTLTFLRPSLASIGRIFIIGIVSVFIVYTLMYFIKPQTLEYNIANIKKLASWDFKTGPRKPIAFYNYATAYPADTKDFLFGSGPGTFNSRSAFMVGSPSYFGKIDLIKDLNQPYYFRNFAYPLWNETNTSQAMYLDGFRNQPFSSILSFLGEYGLLFTLLLMLFIYREYRRAVHLYLQSSRDANAGVSILMYKFLVTFLILLLLIDNYYEYPEIMILIILGMKLATNSLTTNPKHEKQNS